MQASCKFCKYYSKTDDANGECRYTPPQLFHTGGDGTLTAFPILSPDKFCGCFELRGDIDPDVAASPDYGTGERIEVINGEHNSRTGTVIADADEPGIFRVALDDIGIVELAGNWMKPTNE